MTLIELKLVYIITVAFVYIGDLMTKKMAVYLHETGKDGFEIIPGFLEFCYSENSGMAAGMFSEKRLLFIVPSITLMSLIVLYLIFDNGWNPGIGIAASMALGGGLGNMMERLGAAGFVVDSIYVVPFNFFPFDCVFNIADVFICIAGGLFIYEVIKITVYDEKKKLFGEAENTHVDMPRWIEFLLKDNDKKKKAEKFEDNNDSEAEHL